MIIDMLQQPKHTHRDTETALKGGMDGWLGGWGVLEKWAVGGGQLLYLFLVSNLLPLLLQIVWHCVQTATVSKVFLSSPLGKTRVPWVAWAG